VPDYSNAIAITPDGSRVYVPTGGATSAINTATNKVIATIPVGGSGIAITPDGRYGYLAGGNVSVIDTATNTVVDTITVGSNPVAVAIVPPPPSIPFSAFTAKLEIHSGQKPNTGHFNLNASFTLGSASNGINPPAEPVTLQVGTFTTTIPPGSFKGTGLGPFQFHGVIDGVRLEVGIEPTGAERYAFHAVAHIANLTGTKSPEQVTLAIGDDSGTTSVNTQISR
jgi:YVTN family beta-propeller protein